MDIYIIQILSQEEIEPDVVGDLKLTDIEDGDVAETTVSGPLLRAASKTWRLTGRGCTSSVRPRGDVPVHQQSGAVRSAGADVPAAAAGWCDNCCVLAGCKPVGFDRSFADDVAQRAFLPLTIGLARAWFPAALIVLLLLAIPGLVLFVLNLLGLEKPPSTPGSRNTGTSGLPHPCPVVGRTRSCYWCRSSSCCCTF